MKKREDIHKVLIIGSGPIIIGQACEFDYSGTQACKALRSLGYEIVLVNSNPATIMTDPDVADITYVEPLTDTVVGFIFYSEAVTAESVIGIAVILLAVMLVNRGNVGPVGRRGSG